MQKKIYLCPDFTVAQFNLHDVVCASVEKYNENIDDGNTWTTGGADLDDFDSLD